MVPDEDELSLLTVCADNIEASGVRALLDAHGIYSMIQGEQHRSLLGNLGSYIELNLFVRHSELEKAKELLASARPVSPEDIEAPEVSTENQEEKPGGWGEYNLDAYGIKPEDLSDEPRKDRRFLLGWFFIALLVLPVVIGFIVTALESCS
jgi:hypothetical protein